MSTPSTSSIPKRPMSPLHRALAGAAILAFFCLTLVIIGVSFFVSGNVKRQVAAVVEKQQREEPTKIVYVAPPPEPLALPQIEPPAASPVKEISPELQSLIIMDFDPPAEPTQAELDEYTHFWDRITGYWGERNSRLEMLQAVRKVWSAHAYYRELDMRYALASLSEKIPAGWTVTEAAIVQIAGVQENFSNEKGYSQSRGAARGVAYSETSLKKQAESITVIADEIYHALEDNYYAPIIAAQEEASAIAQANADQIAANQEAARNRGMSNNRAKADASIAAAKQQQQFRANNAEASRKNIEALRARGIIR